MHILLALMCSFSIEAQTSAPTTKVSLAVDHGPPYSQISEDGEISGAIVDIFQEIQQQLGFKLELVGCPFSRCIRMLEQGEVNAMGGLILTPKRQQLMHFVTPPYMVITSSFVFYARHESQLEIKRYDDLYGKKIAIMRGAAYFKRFNEDDKLIKVPVLTENTAIDLLVKGRVDLVIGIESTTDHAMSVLNQPINKLVKMDYRHSDTIYGYLALSQSFHNTDLAKRIDEQLKKLADSGELTKLVAPYKLPAVDRESLGF
ncbi:transporter substrate-binding domain-containing protein [Pseudoalteromonas shioyasakiensis]|uniref:substrate-binding periplasmic protein n=1 Tax=Pseudoalteromonas shioyasakiensis TaxID=1190813 RepID=UPI002117C6F2|nr:transporter substrate-binding domain-containing protein [Pseudoalteromonas shioyasakiensis]